MLLLGAVAKTFLMTLLAFFVFPIDRYLNQSRGYCAYALADTVDSSTSATTQALALTMAAKFLLHAELAQENNGNATDPAVIFRKQQAPQVLQIHQPSALWIAVNIRECHLLRGDKLEIRGNRGAANKTIFITAENASFAETAWKNMSSFWDHPFLVQGNTVTVEYFPSMMTLMLPLPKQARTRPVILIDSYVFAFPLFPGVSSSSGSSVPSSASGSGGSNEDAAGGVLPAVTESTVGTSSELKQAVCFKKSEPKMYEKAKSVARLLIRRPNQEDPTSTSSSTSTTTFRNNGDISSPTSPQLPPPRSRRNVGYYCTGWLVGRGNHLMTNYHCLAYLPTSSSRDVVIRSQQGQQGDVGREGLSLRGFRCLLGGCSSSSGSSASSSLSSASSSSPGPPSIGVTPNETVNSATVNFMAETKKCREVGTLGEPAGVIEATKVTVVTANPALDYALLRIDPNDSSVDLAHKYGYLQLRAMGPQDGESIYIPQHPNGEPKEIAATKDRRSAIIRVLPGPQVSTSAAVASLSTSGSGGAFSDSSSNSGSANSPVNPNVFYTADTLPGSSGSPVLSQKDNMVVALHHAGGTAPISFRKTNDPTNDLTVGDSSGSTSNSYGSFSMNDYNSGIRIDLIIDDMRKKNALPPCALARTCARQSRDPCCKAKCHAFSRQKNHILHSRQIQEKRTHATKATNALAKCKLHHRDDRRITSKRRKGQRPWLDAAQGTTDYAHLLLSHSSNWHMPVDDMDLMLDDELEFILVAGAMGLFESDSNEGSSSFNSSDDEDEPELALTLATTGHKRQRLIAAAPKATRQRVITSAPSTAAQQQKAWKLQAGRALRAKREQDQWEKFHRDSRKRWIKSNRTRLEAQKTALRRDQKRLELAEMKLVATGAAHRGEDHQTDSRVPRARERHGGQEKLPA